MASPAAHPVTLDIAVNTVGGVDLITNPDGAWMEILCISPEDPSL